MADLGLVLDEVVRRRWWCAVESEQVGLLPAYPASSSSCSSSSSCPAPTSFPLEGGSLPPRAGPTPTASSRKSTPVFQQDQKFTSLRRRGPRRFIFAKKKMRKSLDHWCNHARLQKSDAFQWKGRRSLWEIPIQSRAMQRTGKNRCNVRHSHSGKSQFNLVQWLHPQKMRALYNCRLQLWSVNVKTLNLKTFV